MAEITPLPADGTGIIAGEWERNPIDEITPLLSGGTAIIAEWRNLGLFLGRPLFTSGNPGLVRS